MELKSKNSMENREKDLAYIVMSKISNVCYLADVETNELLFLNQIAKNLIGIKDYEYFGRKCHEIIANSSSVCNFCTNKYLVKGEYFKWEQLNPIVNRYFEFTDLVFDLGGRDVKLQIGVDMTDTKNRVEELQTQLTLEETLIRCAQSLSEHDDVGVAINILLETISEFYNADRAFIFEISKDESSLSATYIWGSAEVQAQSEQLQNIPADGLGNWQQTLDNEGALYIDSLKHIISMSDLKNIAFLEEVDNVLLAALKIGPKTIGFFGVGNLKSNISQKLLLHSVSLFISNDLKDKYMLAEFERLASVDTFSGLHNRNKYMRTIDQIIADQTDTVGIVYLDINGLKQVNDEYGHEYGDKLILKVVSMLKECFEDNLFRTGGDEFVALYLNGDRYIFEEKVFHLRNIVNIQTYASVSIGSAWCTDTNDISRQIAHADELMYVDKQNYYTTRQFSRKSYRATVAADLQDSIIANEFLILLQPKIRLADEKVFGAEALVRKKDGQGGLIPPMKFIPIYESDGVIPLLDFYVLEAACKVLKGWRETGHPLLPISVNFSRITILEYNVAQKIYDVCQRYGVESKFIIIELTEHISNILLKNLSEILEEIKSYGFQISLDDFGREYANLSILSSIAFNEIKLDKSLIDNLASNPATATAIRCIVEMCNAYRPADMVVEGIETYEQVAKLRELNCNLPVAQGYYFSKPISVEDFMVYHLKHLM